MFTDYWHGSSRFAPDVGAAPAEIAPMGLPPIIQGAITFAFVVGKFRRHVLIGMNCHRRCLNDTQWITRAVEDDVVFADLRNGVAFKLDRPDQFSRRRFDTLF